MAIMWRDALKLAQDKSLRTIDQDGRMHVAVSNITKAIVNPYYGAEIPNGDALGLDPQRVYMLLRDPDELAKAIDTFNNIPLLDRHVSVIEFEAQKKYVVGSTGGNAEWAEPYVRNSLVIWDAGAQAGVTTKVQRELSSAYRYDADMTPGTFNGVAYDGIMRNIRGSHVALVEAGRAGSDVVVGDSKLLELPKMSKKLSAKAILVRGALMGYLPAKLAQDAQIGDLTAIVGSVTSANYAKEKANIAKRVAAAFKDKLAQDADITDVVALLDCLVGDDVALDEEDPEAAAAAKKKKDDEDAAIAKDAEADKEKLDKPAMDAAIKRAVEATAASVRADTIKQMQAIHQAEKDVAPLVGSLNVGAMDSAESVYKMALDHAKIDTEGVDPSAFKAMVAMLKGAAVKAPVIAKDSAMSGKSFSENFPNAGKMKGGA